MKDALQKITGKVVAYDDGWIFLASENRVEKATVDQAAALVIEREQEAMARDIRDQRDALLRGALDRIQRYQLQKDRGDATTDTDAMYYGLLQYAQELRDVTEQIEFPEVVTWPDAPTEESVQGYVPHSVTRRQARLALHEVGKLEGVEQAVEQAGMEARIEYDADAWERSNVFLQGMWAQLGGTEEELDQLFILAATK